jgi:chromosome segregation ATPase
MSTETKPKPVGGLDDLDKAAKEAAEQLGKATSHNAIWDKATKALKPGLAALAKAREDADKEAALAKKLLESLAGNYDSEVSDHLRTIRTAVDENITSLTETMSEAEQALNLAKDDVAAAKKALEDSNASFEAAQKALLGLPKGIQDRQKQVMALEAEVKDAHGKHQLVEAVVKLEDLKKALEDLNDIAKPEYEAGLWTNLSSAADDLIQKTDALPGIQAVVPTMEAEFSQAKAARDEAQKNRLDDIRKSLADV